MSEFKFLPDPKLYSNDSEFVVHLSKVKSEEMLFHTLSSSLRFPEYFGFNWNAISDCLRDFHWIDKKGIVLIHDEMPSLEKPALKIYLEVLKEATEDWKGGEEHYFKVIFPEQSKYVIQEIVK